MEKRARSTKKQSRFITVLFGYWVPVFVWMGIIFFLSSRHSVSVSEEYFINFLFFKTLHLIEYAVLYTLILRASYQASDDRQKRNVYLRAYLITVLYAVTDEFHQSFVPSRTAKPRDVIIDAIGAGIVWYYLSVQLPRAPKILKNWVKRSGLPY